MLHQHAPLQTLIAVLSFLLLGPQDWAPYAANGVLLGLTLIAVFRYLRRQGTSLILPILLVLCLVDVPEGAAIFSYMYLALFTWADINAYGGTQARERCRNLKPSDGEFLRFGEECQIAHHEKGKRG